MSVTDSPHFQVLDRRLDLLVAFSKNNIAQAAHASELLALDWALRELQRLEQLLSGQPQPTSQTCSETAS